MARPLLRDAVKMVARLVASAALGVAALAAPAPILVCPDGSGHASTLGEAQRLWRRQLVRWGGTTVGKTAGVPVGESAAELRVELCAGVHPVRRPLVLTAAAGSPPGGRRLRFLGPGEGGVAVVSGGAQLGAWASVGAGVFRAALPPGQGFVRQLWDADQ
eukprot:COSAG04_NODE_624_length_11804_cov_36.044425_9_plen_160_part_00